MVAFIVSVIIIVFIYGFVLNITYKGDPNKICFKYSCDYTEEEWQSLSKEERKRIDNRSYWDNRRMRDL